MSSKKYKYLTLQEKNDNFVYSFNEQTKKIEPQLIENAFCSGHVTKILKVTLDNGKDIYCTPEHRFMLRDGSYCMANDLTPTQSLMPLYRKYPTITNHKGISVEEIQTDLSAIQKGGYDHFLLKEILKHIPVLILYPLRQ